MPGTQEIKGGECSDSAFPSSLAVRVNSLNSDMVRVVDCRAGVLGPNPGGPKDFPSGIASVLALSRCSRLLTLLKL